MTFNREILGGGVIIQASPHLKYWGRIIPHPPAIDTHGGTFRVNHLPVPIYRCEPYTDSELCLLRVAISEDHEFSTPEIFVAILGYIATSWSVANTEYRERGYIATSKKSPESIDQLYRTEDLIQTHG